MAERTSTKRDRAWLRRSDSFRGNCDLMFFWIWLCKRSTLTNALVNSRLHTRLNVWQTWGRYEHPLPQYCYWRQWIGEQVLWFNLIPFKGKCGDHTWIRKNRPFHLRWGGGRGAGMKVCSFHFYDLACDTYSIWCDNEHSLFCLLMINTRSNLVQPELPVPLASGPRVQSVSKVTQSTWFQLVYGTGDYFLPVQGEHLPVKTSTYIYYAGLALAEVLDKCYFRNSRMSYHLIHIISQCDAQCESHSQQQDNLVLMTYVWYELQI